MLWHILAKDWKILWRVTVGLAAVNIAQRVMLSEADSVGRGDLVGLANIFGVIALIATAALIVVVIQQDPLPTLRQDWLVRPIGRGALLGSKLLYVALLVQGPILLAELCQALMAGLPLGPALSTAFSRSVWMILTMDLPCVALATLTRNMAQTVGSALALAIAFVVIYALSLVFGYRGGPGIRLSTVAWISDSARTVWGVAAVVVVLRLQYRRRKTVRARWVFAIGALVWMLGEMIPVSSAFAVQEWLSRDRSAANSVQLVFAPDVGVAGLRAPNPQSEIVRFGVPQRVAFVFVPLRITGLKDRSWLLSNKTSVQAADLSGKPIDLDANPDAPEFRQEAAHQMIIIPEAAYEPIKDKAVTLRIDYSFTLMEANPGESMPAMAGDSWVMGLGRCISTSNINTGQINLHCVSAHALPCSDWSLDDARAGVRGPRISPRVTNWGYHPLMSCWPDLSPYVAGIGGDPATSLEFSLPIAPLGESQLKDARLDAVVYRPGAHFAQRVVIPNIRLSHWRP
jgi:hypothetical protein